MRDLDGHFPGELLVPCQVDTSERALPEQVSHAIPPDRRRDGVAGRPAVLPAGRARGTFGRTFAAQAGRTVLRVFKIGRAHF